LNAKLKTLDLALLGADQAATDILAGEFAVSLSPVARQPAPDLEKLIAQVQIEQATMTYTDEAAQTDLMASLTTTAAPAPPRIALTGEFQERAIEAKVIGDAWTALTAARAGSAETLRASGQRRDCRHPLRSGWHTPAPPCITGCGQLGIDIGARPPHVSGGLLMLMHWGKLDAVLIELAGLDAAQCATEAVRVKATFLEAPDPAGAAIDVEFNAGRVILSGFVETRAQRHRAEVIASGQEDVDEVMNRIKVK